MPHSRWGISFSLLLSRNIDPWETLDKKFMHVQTRCKCPDRIRDIASLFFRRDDIGTERDDCAKMDTIADSMSLKGSVIG